MSLSTFTPGIFSEVIVSTSAIKRVRTTAKCKNLIIFFNNAGIQKIGPNYKYTFRKLSNQRTSKLVLKYSQCCQKTKTREGLSIFTG